MNSDEARARFEKLPPRTREIVRSVCRNSRWSIVNCATVLGLSISNVRKRLRDAYAALDLEGGRPELITEYGPLFAGGEER